MTIENLLEQLEREHRARINSIIREAKLKASKIIEEAKARAREMLEERKAEIRASVEADAAAILFEAEMEARKKALEEEERILEECFSLAKKKLKRVSGAKYKRFLLNCLKKCKEEIGSELVVKCNVKDFNILKRLARKLKLKVELKKVETIGGFIASSKDGKLSLDFTFETMLERANEVLGSKIIKELREHAQVR